MSYGVSSHRQLDSNMGSASMSGRIQMTWISHSHPWIVDSEHIDAPHRSWIRHDDVIKWKHFPRYWPFVRGIHRSSVRSFDVFFDLRPNKRLCKQTWGWWFDTLSCSLWRHCNGLSRWWCTMLTKYYLTLKDSNASVKDHHRDDEYNSKFKFLFQPPYLVTVFLLKRFDSLPHCMSRGGMVYNLLSI